MSDRRKLPEQNRSRQRVESILEAARQLMIRRGSASFSMSELAKEAGISQSSMYRYFKDKSAVIQMFAEQHSEDASDRIRTAIVDAARGATIAEVCRNGLLAYFTAVRADPVQRYVAAAVQADSELEHLHIEDARRQAQLLHRLLATNVGSPALGVTVSDLALLFSYLAGATANLAGLVETSEAIRLEEGFIQLALGLLGIAPPPDSPPPER